MVTRSKSDIVVGFFVMLGLAAIAFLALKAANLASFTEGDTYRISARFDNIGGLKSRAPVRAAGVLVGRVRSIELDPQTFQGVVEIDLRRGINFPKDTAARIQTAGLLGDQYIGLEAGAEADNLVAGDTISLTQSALVLEQLIGQVMFGGVADEAKGARGSASAK